jgi:hypothetical protein
MELKPYKSISKYALKRLNEGATIVNFLTDWKTPCYIYQLKKEKIRGKDIAFNEVIAVNNGIDTYAETSNETHIFKDRERDNFMIPYLLNKKLIFHGDIPAILHMEKQLSQPFFSTFCINEEVEDIIKDFSKENYKIISIKDVGFSNFMKAFFEATDEHQEQVELLKQEARAFYKSQSGLRYSAL